MLTREKDDDYVRGWNEGYNVGLDEARLSVGRKTAAAFQEGYVEGLRECHRDSTEFVASPFEVVDIRRAR